MSRARLAVLTICLLAPAPALAAWGEKARACPIWEARLAELEAAGEDPASSRLRRLRNKVDGRCVAMNEVQVLGSHNSFHIVMPQQLLNLLLLVDPMFAELDYNHIPLPE